MTLLYLANVRLPTDRAHGLQIVKMCEAFACAGFDVVLLASSRGASDQNLFRYYRVQENFRIVRVPTISLLSLGYIGFVISMLSYTVSAFVYALIYRPTLIYGRDELPLAYLSLFFRLCVWEAHLGKWNLLTRAVARRTAAIVTITHGIRQYFTELGVPDGKIIVAPDGIDESFLAVNCTRKEARARLGLSVDARFVMYIGLFDTWKGYDVLLNAAAQLREYGIGVIMVGGTERQVEKLKTKYTNVIFTGFLPYIDLPINQRAANVLIIPNSAKWEISRTFTSPLKLFAHMASGVPILASDLPSLREVLSEKNSFFMTPDDHEDLARQVIFILEHEEEARTRALHAAQDVRRYTWCARARSICGFLSTVTHDTMKK